MNILVPINSFENINSYIEAGAKEFYSGFYDESWSKEFGEYEDINRLTGFGKSANPYTLKELSGIIGDARNKGAELYITFNSSLYSEKQIEYIRKYFIELRDTGISGVIISCIELASIAKDVGLPIVISTIAGVYNEDIVRFYKSMGAKRVILPRDLSVKEIVDIKNSVDNMEYEVFIMRNGCAYSDAFCLGMHRSEKCSTCCTLSHSERKYIINNDNFHTRHDVELNSKIYNYDFHNEACGICAIYQFVKAGIKAGKIVGRADQSDLICRDINLVAQNIEIANSCSSEEEYLGKMIFPYNRVDICKQGLNCYYPEVRF